MNASSVGVVGTGLGIALQLVAEVGLVACYPHDQGMELQMTLEIALETVIVMLMTAMMVDGMEIGDALTAETTDMEVEIGMFQTGIHLLEIVLATDMVVVAAPIAFLRTDTAKTEALTGTMARVETVGSQLEDQHGMTLEATETGPLLTTVHPEVAALHPSTVTKR